MDIDANKVIDKLTMQVAQSVKNVVMLQAQVDELQEINAKQKELIDAYEDKEKIKEDKK